MAKQSGISFDNMATSWSLRLLGFALALLLVIVGGCQAQPTVTSGEGDATPSERDVSGVAGSENAVPEAPKTEEFIEVATFSGRGPGSTGTFSIATEDYWRLTVTRAGADELSGPFSAKIYRAGEDPATQPDHGAVDGRGEGPIRLHFTETGSFFIQMSDSAEQGWKIRVEEIKTTYPD